MVKQVNNMSEIASFTYIKAFDATFLGAWSKPKPRWFRFPENRFNEFMSAHLLRKLVFEETDGCYVSFVFEWLGTHKEVREAEVDPVIHFVRYNLGGDQWLLHHADKQFATLLDRTMERTEWEAFLKKMKASPDFLSGKESFDTARVFVRDRISEIGQSEALLVSVA